jgi:hypothetical protein
MKTQLAIRGLFLVAGLYDGLLGLAFLLRHEKLFEWFEVTPPNHPGYVQFSAALLVVFGLLFFNVAIGPRRNRNLIPYGILLKVTYCSVVLYYWVTSDLPGMWKPFCAIDAVFLLLFAWAWIALGRAGQK